MLQVLIICCTRVLPFGFLIFSFCLKTTLIYHVQKLVISPKLYIYSRIKNNILNQHMTPLAILVLIHFFRFISFFSSLPDSYGQCPGHIDSAGIHSTWYKTTHLISHSGTADLQAFREQGLLYLLSHSL